MPEFKNDFFNRNYTAKLPPLMVFPTDTDMFIFKKLQCKKQVELAFQDCDIPVFTTFEKYQKNDVKNEYFCVIFCLLDDQTDPANLRQM